jgi:hypothetical protein
MASKKQKFLRGWLPNQFSFSSQNSADKNSPMVQWTARALVVGSVVYALLLVLGDFLGLTIGIGAYLYTAAISGVVWGVVAAVPFLVIRKAKSHGEN